MLDCGSVAVLPSTWVTHGSWGYADTTYVCVIIVSANKGSSAMIRILIPINHTEANEMCSGCSSLLYYWRWRCIFDTLLPSKLMYNYQVNALLACFRFLSLSLCRFSYDIPSISLSLFLSLPSHKFLSALLNLKILHDIPPGFSFRRGVGGEKNWGLAVHP